jgi:hypothetical protein
MSSLYDGCTTEDFIISDNVPARKYGPYTWQEHSREPSRRAQNTPQTYPNLFEQCRVYQDGLLDASPKLSSWLRRLELRHRVMESSLRIEAVEMREEPNLL